jgi:hypothetical protein
MSSVGISILRRIYFSLPYYIPECMEPKIGSVGNVLQVV